MRTSEVADRAGVNSQTLRYYERRGLLAEPPRSPAGYRDYPAHLQQMRARLGELIATCERPRLERSCPLLRRIEGTTPLAGSACW
jgi:hypothetical protein